MFKHRGLTVPTMLSEQACRVEADRSKYLKLEGTGESGKQIFILITPQGETHKKVDNLRTLMEELTGKGFVNIMVIAPSEFSTQVIGYSKNILDHFGYTQNREYVELVTYSLFCLEVPLHPLVPKHEKIKPSERQTLNGQFYVETDTLPRILRSDPAIMWAGMRPGDMCMITRLSDLTGEAVAYRLVV